MSEEKEKSLPERIEALLIDGQKEVFERFDRLDEGQKGIVTRIERLEEGQKQLATDVNKLDKKQDLYYKMLDYDIKEVGKKADDIRENVKRVEDKLEVHLRQLAQARG